MGFRYMMDGKSFVLSSSSSPSCFPPVLFLYGRLNLGPGILYTSAQPLTYTLTLPLHFKTEISVYKMSCEKQES